MNVIKVKVNFKNGTIYKQGIDLISGDYNTTKLIFDFDRQDGRKVFEMKDPDGNLILLTEIVNNEIILVGKDEQGNDASLFNQEGKYIFEISLYDGNSKLTSAFDFIKVKQEQVVVDGKVVTPYLPIFDELVNEVETLINETSNLDIDITTADDTTRVEITKKDGTKKSAIVSGGAGTITDVKVDGNSVVKGGVADINFKTINNQTITGEGNITIEGGNGVVGADGKSAYEIWLEQGNTGTEQDFLNSLKGEPGKDGKDGADGKTPVKGVDYFDGKDGVSGVYVGSGEMPDGYNVQIDPTGEVDKFVKTVNGKTPDERGNVDIEVSGGDADTSTERIEKTTTDNVSTLEPNKFYVFPEMSSLAITLGGETNNSIVQEYRFRFTSGATATTLTLPADVIGDITVEANKIYEVSIIDNLLVSQSWEVS